MMSHPDTFDSCSSDLLAVIELDALQPLATLQVFQSVVCDQGAVIQLDHLQPLLTTHAAAQVSNPIVCYQLTMREALQHAGLKTHKGKSSLVLVTCQIPNTNSKQKALTKAWSRGQWIESWTSVLSVTCKVTHKLQNTKFEEVTIMAKIFTKHKSILCQVLHYELPSELLYVEECNSMFY